MSIQSSDLRSTNINEALRQAREDEQRVAVDGEDVKLPTPESGQDIPVPIEALDATRGEKRKANYAVLRQVGDGMFELLGTFEAATQQAARTAAVRADEDLLTDVLNGKDVVLVATAHFAPKQVRAETPEPQIVA